MSADIVSLPSASPSYYTIRKEGQFWTLQIVTPNRVGTLRTTVARFADREGAIASGRKTASELRLPFKSGRARDAS